MKDNYVAIMAGGIGSRFWPESRTSMPKQFLDILGTGSTLIQSTYKRFLHLCPKENIYIVTNKLYEPLVKQQLPDINDEQILGEPMRKNTAPCVAFVSSKILQKNENANIIVAPSDHLITEETAFIEYMKKGLDFVGGNDQLVTLGILPTRPDTGYGYIQYHEDAIEEGIHKVKTFTEKPDEELAKTFLSSGDFLWNSGIFIWNVKAINKAFSKFLPEISDAFKLASKHFGTSDEESAIENAFSVCTNISIDYGIMEKADNVYVLPSSFGWSDLGTWASLYAKYSKDYLCNAVQGKNVMLYDTNNCMVMAPENKLMVLQGLDDYIVIDTEDVLLVCQKNKEQFIKQITADVKHKKGDSYL